VNTLVEQYLRDLHGFIAAHPFLDNAIKAAFTTDEISKYLWDVENLEKTVGQDAVVMTAECITAIVHSDEVRNVDST
jgi:hypothetical protein